MVKNQRMPQIYYQVVRQIYVGKTWRSFAVKASLLAMITILHHIISLDRVRLLPAPVMGGARVLPPPPRKAGNLQNYFSYFRQYLHDAVIIMELLQLFLIMLPEDYIEKVLIPETNKGLIVPMNIQEFIKWVGCCPYIA